MNEREFEYRYKNMKLSQEDDSLTKFIAAVDIVNQHKLLRTKYNVSKSEMHSLLINAFHIPVDIAVAACKQYFTRKYKLAARPIITEGSINYLTHSYLVVYHQCTPYSVSRCKQLFYSFRQAQDEFNLPAYVLIKILPTEEE